MSTVEIFGFAPSTYTQTALLTAAEKGVPVTLQPLEFGKDSHRALHPFLKMPALRHGGILLYETAAIAVYLDEAFPGPSLQPKGPLERARMWQWVSIGIDYGYDALVRSALGHGDDAAMTDTTARDRILDLIEAAVSRSAGLVGQPATLADLVLMPMVRFQANAAKDEPLRNRPGTKAWLDRLTARQSFTTLAAA